MSQRHYPLRPSFSQRQGKGPLAQGLGFDNLRVLLFETIEMLTEEGYFQEALGYNCVDADYVHGRLGSKPDLWFRQRIGQPALPLEQSVMVFDPDGMCDLIEAMHDIVAMGVETDGAFHNWNGCGWHYQVFDKDLGQQRLRDELNPLLERLEEPLRLTPEGILENIGPADLYTLLAAEIKDSAGPGVKPKVEAAVRRYRRSRSSKEERHAAVRELADVLEYLRPQVKLHMMNKDERDLFELANNFAIRHHDRAQGSRYDSAIWLAWIFYVYLATIHAVTQVLDRERRNSASASSRT